MARYSDDRTHYVTGNDLESVTKQFEHAAKLLFQWFSDNQMTGNEDKCHVLVHKKKCVNIGTTQIM